MVKMRNDKFAIVAMLNSYFFIIHVDNVSDFGGKLIYGQRKSRYDYLYDRGWSDES